MNYSNSKISTSTHIDLYTGMLIPRMIEEKNADFIKARENFKNGFLELDKRQFL